MAIDPSIAMGYRGLGELPNPMNQLAQVSQIQSSQRQGEMAQMQLQQMRRDETALTQFYADVAKNGGPTNPVEIEDAMIKSGVRDIVNSGLTARMTRSKLENQQKQFATIMGARMPTGAPMTAPAAAPMAAPDLAQGNALMPTPRASVPSVNALTGGGANNAAEIAFKQQQRDALIGMGTTQAIAAAKALDADIALLARPPQRNLAASPGQTIYGPGGEIVAVTPEKPLAPPSMVAEYTFAKTPDGGSYKGSFADFKRLNRPAASAGAGGAPTGKPLTALQERKAKETEVAQRSVVKSADTAATELETLADTLLGNPNKKIPPHPGLGGITGFMGVLPSMPESEARSAQQKLDTFKGKVMAFGRQLAVQQGKLGNMAVSEWKFISDAIEKIDPAANNFNEQLRDVVRQAKDFAAAKRETFDELYDSTTPTGASAKPSAAVAPALTSADQQALDWASANPKDPRATQIKKRLGRD